MHYEIHNKKLPIPSFFQVYNFGGGRGDKDREIVYSEFTKDTPALINYYYINNEYPHEFQYKIFDDLSGYDTVGDLYNVIRKELITKGELFSDYNSPEYDFNDKVFLLDSGAASIVKQVAVDIKYDKEIFREALIKHLHRYYDFAHELKFDIVVGFDLGGKYTEKDGKNDVKLKEFLLSLDTDDINNFLIEESVKYLSKKVDYYLCVLATVHGKTPDDYKACANYILELEKKYNYRFWGFALGGIASYKKLDKSWFDGISFKNLNKNDFAPLVGPAIASRIVRSLDKERPIHALGCGGYPNIVSNYFCGATSFDAATPARRVCDGNKDSAALVHTKIHYKKGKPGFSQYFIGGFNVDGSQRKENPDYINLNEVPDDMEMCGCPACQSAESILNIKNIYAKKVNDDKEAFFYSRQLMGLHAVFQHKLLCEKVAEYDDLESFCSKYSNDLNDGILKVYKQL